MVIEEGHNLHPMYNQHNASQTKRKRNLIIKVADIPQYQGQKENASSKNTLTMFIT